MNTYHGVMYSINGERFSCNPFYLNYFAGRMYPKKWDVLNARFDCA